MLALRITFALLLVAVLAGLSVFLYRRLVRDVTGSRALQRTGAAAFIVLAVLMPVGRFFLPPADGFARTAAIVVSTWWGLALFTALPLLGLATLEWLMARRGARAEAPAPQAPPAATEAPSDPSAIAEPPLDITRRRVVARLTAGGALAFGGAFSAFGAWKAFAPPEVIERAIHLPGLPRSLDGFTIVQLSDLHIGPIIQEHFVDRLVELVNGARPDLVAITGDLVDGTPAQLGPFVARLAALRSKHGTYFVSGNHDYYSGWERWAPELERLGFQVLRNRFTTIGDAGGSFDLIGVDDWGSRWAHNGYDLDRATAGRDPERASVLLAHQPNGLEQAADHRIGLQLSGHTHGGQFFPGTVVGELVWGERNAGLSRYQGTQLYTSRGCGFVGPPMRLGAPPEIARLVLVSEAT